MASDVLPAEIISEIFSRLSPQSLLRFRSTSKSLKSIIDSHNFTNLHLKNSHNFNLILRHSTNLYQLHFPNITTATPLHHPLSYTNRIALFGSCNGILCISSDTEIAFWNPNIRKHRIIPHFSILYPQSESKIHFFLFTYGFGFDPLSSDDYKLIRICWFVHLENLTFDSYVSLFTSKTNSWKILPTIEYASCYVDTMGVFVENSLHWIMVKKPDGLHPRLILAFNLTLEVFNEVPFPDEIRGEEVICNRSFEINVADLGGCLCLIVNHQTTKIDVWVMKEYGCRDSWFKVFTLIGPCFVLPLKSLSPLSYSSDGKKVLLEVNKKLVWYDLKSQQVSYVEGIPNFNEAMICVGSLVPPSFPVDNSRKKENRSSKSKRRDDFLSRGFKLTL